MALSPLVRFWLADSALRLQRWAGRSAGSAALQASRRDALVALSTGGGKPARVLLERDYRWAERSVSRAGGEAALAAFRRTTVDQWGTATHRERLGIAWDAVGAGRPMTVPELGRFASEYSTGSRELPFPSDLERALRRMALRQMSPQLAMAGVPLAGCMGWAAYELVAGAK
jgi:hypothetical protein